MSATTTPELPTSEQFEAFCDYYGVSFYSMGEPDNWNDHSVFRVATSDFPQRGVTISVNKVVEFVNNPPYLGENI